MMIKLFATDLDGTLLLSKQPGCDEKIYNTLKQMIDKNYLMCFATGRNLREIEMEEYVEIACVCRFHEWCHHIRSKA